MRSKRRSCAPFLTFGLCVLLDCAALDARAQDWRIDGAPMRIPSLEALSRPLAARPHAPVAPEDAEGPLGPFLTDSSLRRGDIVVTRDGLKEFRGGDGFTHAPGDFAPVEAGAAASARGAFRSRPLPPIQQPP